MITAITWKSVSDSDTWPTDETDLAVVKVYYMFTDTVGDNRNVYKTVIRVNAETLYEDSDLRSGSGDPVDAVKAMQTLASFIGAWQEALNSEGMSDNRDMFPDKLIPFIDGFADEFIQDMYEMEGEE